MAAGEILVERAADSVDRFDLIYPIIFNYRHGLEVAIKWVLDHYGRYASIGRYEKNHKLLDLWKPCRLVIEQVGGPGDNDALNAVEEIVTEFDSIDPGALSFRYSTTKKGQVVDLPDFAIDLDNLREVMEGVNNFFIGVDGQLDHNSSAIP
jgi:hypothetical protein